MSRKVLKSKTSEDITWLEAIVRTMDGIDVDGPASTAEILDYMLSAVVDYIPSSAKTPINTINALLISHSKNADEDKKIFCTAGRGLWMLYKGNETVDMAEITARQISLRYSVQQSMFAEQMPTPRQIYDAYIEENSSDCVNDILLRFGIAVRKLDVVLDTRYDLITNEAMDEGIAKGHTDLAKTTLAFLIHEFD